MRLATEARDVSSSGVLETARATVKATAKVFSFFSDNVYADKFVAIVRELAANGVDSHVMAGRGEWPVEIWLPTDLDPVFRVRDHGLGMSHQFMMTNFMAYSDGSTKDGDNLAIGGFGIGSKSPFAYTDAYCIRSVHDGIVSVYSIFKDEEGIPGINLLAQQTTTESNGVEVSFPVQAGDGQKFEEAAFKVLNYFEPLPIVHNSIKGAFQPPQYASRGARWGMREKAGELNIIMGGVKYPCATYSLDYDLRTDSRLSTLLSYGLDLRIPIGSCDIALSREALSYTTKTNQAVRAALEAVIDEIAESFSTMFDHHENLWDAKEALCQEIGIGSSSGYNNRGKFLEGNAFYRGAKLEPYVQAPTASVWEIEDRQSRRATTSLKTTKWEYSAMRFAPNLVETIIIDDLPISPKSKMGAKVRIYVNEECDRHAKIYVMRPSLGDSVDTLLTGMGNPPHVLTSSLPEPPVEARTKAVRPNVRLFTYDGRQREEHCNDPVNNLNPGGGTRWGGSSAGDRKGVREIAYVDQPYTGILVEMSNFELRSDLRTKIATGLIGWNELHFANAVDAAKLKKSWETFDDVWAERLADALSAYPELPQRMALQQDPHLKHLFDFICRSRIDRQLSERQKKTAFGKICALYNKYVEPLTNDQLRLVSFVSRKLPSGVNPEQLLTKHNLNTRLCEVIQLVGSNTGYNHIVLEFIK